MAGRCGAKTRSGAPCRHPAGFRTDHPGEGRCWLHGGRSPVKHGLYATCTRGRVRELYELLKDAPANDASEEIRLGMAQLGAAIEQIEDLGKSEQRELLGEVSLHLSRLILAKQRQAKLHLAQKLEITGGDGKPLQLEWIGGLTERFDGDDGDSDSE